MSRRAFLCGAISTALAKPLAVAAQQAGEIPRIGLLANVRSPAIEAFLSGLRQLGYIESQNIVVEWRLAAGKFERLPELAAELVGLNVDVILAPGPPYVTAARKATTTIPIVFALVPDPVATGLVASLARPGGNLTGLTNSEVEMQGKRIELLKELVPTLVRVAVLSNPGADARHAAVEQAAASLGIQREVVTVAGPDEIDDAFELMKGKGIGAVVELPRSPRGDLHAAHWTTRGQGTAGGEVFQSAWRFSRNEPSDKPGAVQHSDIIGFGPVWPSLEATSWVIPG